MRYTGPMNKTRTRNEYGDYVCTVCGTASNFHTSVTIAPTEPGGFTQFGPCPNEEIEPRPYTDKATGLVVGIVQALRKHDVGEYVLFDRLAFKWLRECDNGAFRYCYKDEATRYIGAEEAEIRAMMAGGEARPMAL